MDRIFKRWLSLWALIIVIAVVILLILFTPATLEKPSHSCRMWGVTISTMHYSLELTIRKHLDSLKNLGSINKDGWAIGYYVLTKTDTLLPIVSRGEPSAPYDPRYNLAVTDLVTFMNSTGIAHVRNRSSGPNDIPNPHPFFRKSLNRNLNLLFAHNGSVATDVLLELIKATNSNYLGLNPPDYPDPSYLDSDLYFLFIVEIIDTYLSESIENCIRIAVAKIDSALGPRLSQLNFVMTDGYTLWALRFAESIPDYYTLYYYPSTGPEASDYWIVASEPLDCNALFWTEIPDATIVTLRPNELPVFTYINGPPISTSYSSAPITNTLWPNKNPSRGGVMITYRLDVESDVRLSIYDIKGTKVRDLMKEIQIPGVYSVTWNGRDDENNSVPAGAYFCNLSYGDNLISRKIILLK